MKQNNEINTHSIVFLKLAWFTQYDWFQLYPPSWNHTTSFWIMVMCLQFVLKLHNVTRYCRHRPTIRFTILQFCTPPWVLLLAYCERGLQETWMYKNLWDTLYVGHMIDHFEELDKALDSYSGWTSSHSQQQCIKGPFCPHPHYCLLFFFLMIAIIIRVRRNLNVILLKKAYGRYMCMPVYMCTFVRR